MPPLARTFSALFALLPLAAIVPRSAGATMRSTLAPEDVRKLTGAIAGPVLLVTRERPADVGLLEELGALIGTIDQPVNIQRAPVDARPDESEAATVARLCSPRLGGVALASAGGAGGPRLAVYSCTLGLRGTVTTAGVQLAAVPASASLPRLDRPVLAISAPPPTVTGSQSTGRSLLVVGAVIASAGATYLAFQDMGTAFCDLGSSRDGCGQPNRTIPAVITGGGLALALTGAMLRYGGRF